MSNSTLEEYLSGLLEHLDPLSDDYAAITEALRAQAGLLVSEWPHIKRILTKGDTDDEKINGEVAVSFATKFVECGKRIKGAVKISYAEKFTADAEFITPDNDQRSLFGEGASVTIKTGETEVSMSADSFSRAAKRLAKGTAQ